MPGGQPEKGPRAPIAQKVNLAKRKLASADDFGAPEPAGGHAGDFISSGAILRQFL